MRSAQIEKAMPGPDDQDPDKSSWSFEEGDEIDDGLVALSLLGGGRRYEAYLAHDEAMWTTVVVKIVRPALVSESRTLEGLAAEQHNLETLNHPYLPRSFGAILEGERPYLVQEFLEGPRLSTLIRKYGRLPLEQLIPLAVQLASAIHYMHGREMVHLDVKPSNIIMAAPPRLIDMSIAMSFNDVSTLRGHVGTDDYMSPEQSDPKNNTVGPLADIWGIGVTLYEAVNGRLPFPRTERRDGKTYYPQLDNEPAPHDPEVPLPLTEIIDSTLLREPSGRPSAREVAEALEPLVAALPRKPVLSRLRPKLR
jgi:serine/threonine-protein kinase